MSNFEGVMPAIITPFTPSGELHETAFRKAIEFNIQAGVHGFWIAGGTGESVYLDDDENRRLAEIAADQVSGRVVKIMHVGAANTRRAIKLAEHAAGLNVEAICAVPPFFYRTSDEAIVEHYRQIAAAANLPLFVYNLPSCTGVEITPTLLKKIQDVVPQLAGLKHSGPAFTDVWHFAKMGVACFTGRCQLMLSALTMGAVGCIDGPLSVAPELWVEIWNAYQAGDLARAERAQNRASAVGWEIVNHGFPTSIKVALSLRLGIDCGDPRPPLTALTPEKRKSLEEALRAFDIGPVSTG